MPAWIWFPTMLLVKMYESCIKSGHLVTLLISCLCTSQIFVHLLNEQMYLLNENCLQLMYSRHIHRVMAPFVDMSDYNWNSANCL